MNDILDSSAWLACLDAEPNTIHFRPILLRVPNLLVPSIVLTEVRKVILRKKSVQQADEVTRSMRSCTVIPIDETIAVYAADLSIRHKLPIADSLIYAVALAHSATLWTQDEDFKGLPSVQYFPKIQS